MCACRVPLSSSMLPSEIMYNLREHNQSSITCPLQIKGVDTGRTCSSGPWRDNDWEHLQYAVHTFCPARSNVHGVKFHMPACPYCLVEEASCQISTSQLFQLLLPDTQDSNRVDAEPLPAFRLKEMPVSSSSRLAGTLLSSTCSLVMNPEGLLIYFCQT